MVAGYVLLVSRPEISFAMLGVVSVEFYSNLRHGFYTVLAKTAFMSMPFLLEVIPQELLALGAAKDFRWTYIWYGFPALFVTVLSIVHPKSLSISIAANNKSRSTKPFHGLLVYLPVVPLFAALAIGNLARIQSHEILTWLNVGGQQAYISTANDLKQQIWGLEELARTVSITYHLPSNIAPAVS